MGRGRGYRKDLRAIWAMAHRIFGQGQEAYEELHYYVEMWTGKTSLRTLTAQERREVIQNLRRMVIASNVITEGQVYRIRALQRRLGWGDQELERFAYRTVGWREIPTLSRRKAERLIRAMEEIANAGPQRFVNGTP